MEGIKRRITDETGGRAANLACVVYNCSLYAKKSQILQIGTVQKSFFGLPLHPVYNHRGLRINILTKVLR